jgi:hypothetical protein
MCWSAGSVPGEVSDSEPLVVPRELDWPVRMKMRWCAAWADVRKERMTNIRRRREMEEGWGICGLGGVSGAGLWISKNGWVVGWADQVGGIVREGKGGEGGG